MDEELLEMAKEENIELNAEEAAQAFAKMNRNGELSDEELDKRFGRLRRKNNLRGRNRIAEKIKIFLQKRKNDSINK